MAIQMTAGLDSHLYSSAGNNFTASTAPFSISVWINAVWNGGTRLSFVGMYDGTITAGTTTGLQIGTGAGAGEVTCWTYGGATMVASANAVMTPFNNLWTLVTYTYDGTNHRVYNNNVLLATAVAAQIPGTFTQVYINGFPPTGSASETATYQVDSYAYYNRTLSLEEVTSIYNARGTRHGITFGLLARYDFDELSQGSSATNVIDVSGNGNTMINTGAGAPITYTYTNTIANANLRPVQ
jgi:hypothetical protein